MNSKYPTHEAIKAIIWSLVIIFSIETTVVGEVASDASNASKDTLQLIKNTAQALEREIVSPSSNEMPVGSYGTVSQGIVRNHIFHLVALGPAHADDIYKEAKSQDSRSSTALLISLGLMEDTRVHDDIREIVRTETDPNLRAMAIAALSAYKDTLDVPVFVEALSDTNDVTMELDVATLDGQFHKRVNMVAMEAVPALYKLGYRWEVDSINGGYEAVRINKSDKK